jgi:hypothetical protein
MNRRITALGVAAAAPVMVLLVLEAFALTATGITGDNPRVPDVTLNLTEAVAVRDQAEMMRLIERGDDPNRREPVREGLLEDDTVNAMPIEAAVSLRQPELVSLLYQNGAALGAEDWRRLTCYAKREELASVLKVLTEHMPAGAAMDCAGDETLFPPGS